MKKPYLSSTGYKRLSKCDLITMFQPLISKLGRAYGEGRFKADVEQDCVLALLRCHKSFRPHKGCNFPKWANMYLKWAAKCSRMRNCSAVDIGYTTYVKMQSLGITNPQNTECLVHPDGDGGFSGVDIPAPAGRDLENDDLDAALKLISRALSRKHAAPVCQSVMASLRKVCRGQAKTVSRKHQTMLQNCLQDTVLSDSRVLRAMLGRVS